jgi:ankyrin repeat protein
LEGEKMYDTALIEAVKRNHIKLVKCLIEHGANINYNNGASLKEACMADNLETVRLLVQSGACVDYNYGEIQSIAIKGGNLEIIKCLVKKTKQDIKTLVKRAAEAGHLEVVKYLVGIESFRQDLGKAFCISESISFAIQRGHLEVVKYLIESGSLEEDNLAFYLWRACSDNEVDIVKYLINDQMVDPLSLGNDLLLDISRRDQLELIKFLVTKGVDFTFIETDVFSKRVLKILEIKKDSINFIE